LVFAGYAYIGYPICLALLARLRARTVSRADITPRVSFVIAAHNEAKGIAAKLLNTLSQDYPQDRFEIIVASDCSTDDTDRIVRSYASRGVQLTRTNERRGKEYAQGIAVSSASGDVLVFSDVATRLDQSAVRNIVKSFGDPTVGCVSSVDRLIDREGHPTGEGAYVRYEMLLRRLETRAGSVVGLSGSFFAARREVCTPWTTDVPSDFATLFNAVRAGLRGISDDAAVGYYPDLADPSKEYARKVRTIVRGVNGLRRNRDMLNPFRYGLFAWQLASHKLCRWLVPFALLGAAAANLGLAAHPFYFVTAVGQVTFYVLAATALLSPTRVPGIWRSVGFLVLANLSILDAWIRLIRGHTIVTWTPSAR
jgi:glycosyltransferase involved in cell wall biosynthesis